MAFGGDGKALPNIFKGGVVIAGFNAKARTREKAQLLMRK